MNSFTIALSALATYRVVRLVVIEEGPFSLSLRLRGRLDPDQRTWIGRGLACPWCISFWIAPLLLWAARSEVGALIVGGLAISAIVGLACHTSDYVKIQIERHFRLRGHTK